MTPTSSLSCRDGRHSIYLTTDSNQQSCLCKPTSHPKHVYLLIKPSHLLGKKSWNVYNPAAIAKVRADEAAAAAREEAEDQRQDAYEAESRLAQLRGLPPPVPPRSPSPVQKQGRADIVGRNRDEERKGSGGERKRRKLRGEDDTERDIRYARQDRERNDDRRGELQLSKKEASVALTDHAGHIQLFAPPSTKEIRATKDAEADHEKKKQESAEQGALKFSEAAGFRKDIKGTPWYAASRDYSGTEELDGKITHGEEGLGGKDAFGRDDPNRVKRDAVRLNLTDPMAVMSQAQRKLKAVEKERLNWQQERERELKELEYHQRRRDDRDSRRSRREPAPEDDLDDFRLDNVRPPGKERYESRRREHHHHTSHQRHSRSSVEAPKSDNDRTRRHRSRSPNRRRSHDHRHRNHAGTTRPLIA